jgi:hypothetical protein
MGEVGGVGNRPDISTFLCGKWATGEYTLLPTSSGVENGQGCLPMLVWYSTYGSRYGGFTTIIDDSATTIPCATH